MTDKLHAVALLSGFAAIAAGAYLAWGLGYALLASGSLMLAAVIRARAISPGATE